MPIQLCFLLPISPDADASVITDAPNRVLTSRIVQEDGVKDDTSVPAEPVNDIPCAKVPDDEDSEDGPGSYKILSCVDIARVKDALLLVATCSLHGGTTTLC